VQIKRLVELVRIKNGTEVIVHKTSVIAEEFDFSGYLVSVEGAFKLTWKEFELAHFTLPIYKASSTSEDGYWSLNGEPDNTISFFYLGCFRKYCCS
jgi:hypothetical protein